MTGVLLAAEAVAAAESALGEDLVEDVDPPALEGSTASAAFGAAGAAGDAAAELAGDSVLGVVAPAGLMPACGESMAGKGAEAAVIVEYAVDVESAAAIEVAGESPARVALSCEIAASPSNGRGVGAGAVHPTRMQARKTNSRLRRIS